MNPKTNPRSGWMARALMCVCCLAAMMGLTTLPGCGLGGEPGPEPLIVYCAHDQVYARQILDRFTEQTGIPVTPRFDTEQTKSLGLTEQLIAEKDNPVADVFWNNQMLGTMDLLDEDILEPYKGPSWQRIPEKFKDPEGRFVGFGARFRVWIINKNADLKLGPFVGSIHQPGDEQDLSRVAIAKPIYGTTLTHYAVMWDVLGADRAKKWHQSMLQRGLVQRGGNAQVKNLVASGTCDVGLTDTDDALVAINQDEPVEMVPFELPDDGRTICIPNTAAIIKGTQKLEAARKLVDFLASEAIEVELANGSAKQVPLGPVDRPEERLPEIVQELKPLVENGYPLRDLVDERRAALEYLRGGTAD